MLRQFQEVERPVAEDTHVVKSLLDTFLTTKQKIQALPAERIAEIEDFVEFIAAREQDRMLTRACTAASAPAFAAVWSNPDDDAYDAL